MGSDISGEVAKWGRWWNAEVGDRVLLAPGIVAALRRLLERPRQRLPQLHDFGVMVDGGYAEYVKSPASNVIPIPGDLNFEEAACGAAGVPDRMAHAVWARAKLQPGEDVLVVGAGSGVGIAAIQVAKLVGCRVITVAGHGRKT